MRQGHITMLTVNQTARKTYHGHLANNIYIHPRNIMGVTFVQNGCPKLKVSPQV